MTNVIEIEGIGEVYAEKLNAVGITTVEGLLEAGATRKGRETLAESSGISGKLILTWVNHADLFRIKGVQQQYAELLEAAGVDSVPELSHRDPANLTKKMAEVNEAKNLVRQVPSETSVAQWVAEAKTLPRVVTH